MQGLHHRLFLHLTSVGTEETAVTRQELTRLAETLQLQARQFTLAYQGWNIDQKGIMT